MDNVDDIIKMSDTTNNSSIGPSDKFPIDFRIVFDTDKNVKLGQQEKLRNLVATKNTFGHFMWMYLSSIVAILVSLLACVINS
jgi:hypothetical protein